MIMDYKERYEEALDRARKLQENSNGMILKKWLWNIFPELKMSEDERIRKELLQIAKESEDSFYMVMTPNKREKLIAWLERQSKKESDPRYKYLKELLIADDIYQMAMNDGMVGEAKTKATYALSKLEIGKLLGFEKKQGEQKHDVKAEPRFQNGQWIVWQNKCYKVNYNGCGYELIDQNGLSTSLEYGTIDENARIWDITKDAKDGDVLVAPPIKGQEGKEQIFIFKGINSRDYVDNCIEYYCRVYEGVFYENENGYMGTTSSPIYPATKEQRDTLESAITNVGYRWDKEKLKLEKI